MQRIGQSSRAGDSDRRRGFLLGRLVESQLFGVKAEDPLIFAVSAATLAAVALLAALYPAWKASRTDPLTALKYE